MEEKSLPSATLSASNVLIIPTFREFRTDAPMLWEANNLWRKVWEEESKNPDDFITFISIPTNGSNYAAIDARKALNLDSRALDQISYHNRIPDIFIADAVYNGLEGLTVTIYSYADGSSETLEVYGERTPQLILNGISEVKKSIENKLKRQSIVESGEKNEVEVLYNYYTMSDWVKVENSLKDVPGIQDVRMIAMSSGKVQFRIRFSGSVEKLQSKLREHLFTLTNYGDFYTLERM